MTEKLTTLAKRLRPFFAGQVQAMAGAGVLMTEGPDIDIVGQTIGRGGDTILLFDSGGNPVAEYAATGVGLVAALAATTSGDEIQCPYNIALTHTAGLTIPAGVKVRDLVITLTCGGNGVTMNTGSELWHSLIIQDGQGQALAVALNADGLASANIGYVTAVARNATTNIGIKAGGTGKFTRPTVGSSNGTGTNGGTNYGIWLTDYGLAFASTGTAQDGATANIGIALVGTTAAKAATASQCAFFARGNVSYGLGVGNGQFGIASACTFDGVTGGVNIDAGGTLYAADNYWTSLNNNGTLTYLQGDRGAYAVEEYHASDIEAAALTRHNPLPGSSGNIVTSDGTNWVSQAPGTALAGTILGYIVVYEDDVATLDGEVVWLI